MKTGEKKPLRTCVGCRMTKEKSELIRVVKEKNGDLCFDPLGRKNGRGAYICRSVTCLKVAEKNHSLERSLKISNSDKSIYQKLFEELKRYE